MLLDGEFDETWGDLLALTTIFEKEEPGEHHVRIEVCRTHEKDFGVNGRAGNTDSSSGSSIRA